jgi:hypothetical protein
LPAGRTPVECGHAPAEPEDDDLSYGIVASRDTTSSAFVAGSVITVGSVAVAGSVGTFGSAAVGAPA